MVLARSICGHFNDSDILKCGGLRADRLLDSLLRVVTLFVAGERKPGDVIDVIHLTYSGFRRRELVLEIIIFLRLNYLFVPIGRVQIT